MAITMKYKKGHTYACFRDKNGKTIFDDNIGNYSGIYAAEVAVEKWKALTIEIINYLSKNYNTTDITVDTECHINRINNQAFTTNCYFKVNGKYAGYSTVTVYNNI